jgi:hypothetical protein
VVLSLSTAQAVRSRTSLASSPTSLLFSFSKPETYKEKTPSPLSSSAMPPPLPTTSRRSETTHSSASSSYSSTSKESTWSSLHRRQVRRSSPIPVG